MDLQELKPEDQLEGVLKISMEDILLLNPLGNGSFAEVFLGKYADHHVAVKKLQPLLSDSDCSLDGSSVDSTKDLNEESVKEFFREVTVMSHLAHPNIVEMIGVVTSPPCLVLEFMDAGSLYDYIGKLKDQKSHALSPQPHSLLLSGIQNEDSPLFTILESLPWISRLLLSTDIADAMTFLHERKYIHRDLKSPNILLQFSVDRERSTDGICTLKAKVADFGTSRQTDLIHTFSTSNVENPRWLAPEIIERLTYNELVDVYSFGME